jgi:hypothetical protein
MALPGSSDFGPQNRPNQVPDQIMGKAAEQQKTAEKAEMPLNQMEEFFLQTKAFRQPRRQSVVTYKQDHVAHPNHESSKSTPRPFESFRRRRIRLGHTQQIARP